ncbi:uncharacterized protein LOC129732882 [Wyeomyia smithii]|uniref:uncharacterized protein LOC129732882 n=1 Tax=Wyeomyia smithii TaxID=174621 RepID=UPI002467B994|nr:uncharacterized protein LOC129732882 [Wyeomyia smithii]
MDKSIARAKRRQDKSHKKRPPGKGSEAAPKTTKPVDTPEPLIVYDDRYSKRPIQSNWSAQQEISSDESEDGQSRAADFEKLLRQPHSVSGHFFLSTEKHWVKEASEPVISTGKGNERFANHFKIDTKQLNASFATIPFHERNEYPLEIFTESEINSMKLKAELESKKYQNLCSKLEASKKMADSRKPVKNVKENDALPLRISSKNNAAQVETNQPQQPVPCLIGPMALPPELHHNSNDQVTIQPQQPVPCLIGPMALPAELRHDPNVTGSYNSLQQATSTEITTPNRSQDAQAAAGVKNSTLTRQEDTKEAIQQWLDDILDM